MTGDNLVIMRKMNSKCVDLIYLDPPFNSNRNYAAPAGSKAAGAEFTDTWTKDDIDECAIKDMEVSNPEAHAAIMAAGKTRNEEMKSYLSYMAPRLEEMKRILKDNGTIVLHCDNYASHTLRNIMDAIFGSNNFFNEIIWQRSKGRNGTTKSMPQVLDHLLVYSLPGAFYSQQYTELDKEYVKKDYKYDDKDGRGLYRRHSISAPRGVVKSSYTWRGFSPPENGWRYAEDKLDSLFEEGRIYIPTYKNGDVNYKKQPQEKRYLSESKGICVTNLWTDINCLQGKGESTGYPTQKPLKLLDRIIKTFTQEGATVFDPFCGSGTTLIAANRLGRKWVGIDVSSDATRVVHQRFNDDPNSNTEFVSDYKISKQREQQ